MIMVATALLGIVCGGGSDSGGDDAPADEDPGAAAVRLETLLRDEGYDAYFDKMHPAMSQYVSAAKFSECAERGEAGVVPHQFDAATVLGVRDLREAVFVPETYVAPGDEPKVVNLQLTGADSAFVTSFVARSDGEWRWFFESAAIRAYRFGTCPGG
jgi:hypothetical protein